MYYVIIDSEIAIGTKENLKKIYNKTATKLPDDYNSNHYVVVDGELVVDPNIKKCKLQELDAKYDADKAELVKYFGEAALAGDTEAQAELTSELAELNETYDAARREIEGE